MYKYQSLVPCTTRLGVSPAGTLGVGYDQANGFINFFPDKGGYALLKTDQVKPVRADMKERSTETPQPISVLQAMAKPVRKIERTKVRVIVRNPVRKIMRTIKRVERS